VASDLLTVLASAQGEKVAVIEDRPDSDVLVLTFDQLNSEANRLGHHLLALGAGPGTKIAWCGANSTPIMVMSHAARKIGATAVPLNYRLSPEEAAYVVDNSDAEIVFVDAEYLPLVDGVRASTPKVRHVLVFGGDGTLEREVSAASEAEIETPGGYGGGRPASTMIYTSGTTGKPKGALRTGRGDPRTAAELIGAFGYRRDDIYLTTGPLYHSGPGGFAVIAHNLGQTVVIQRRFDPEDWLRLVDTHRVTSTFSAPTPIRLVCALPEEVKARYDRSSMRIMVANAAPWSLALKQRYLADFPPDSLFEVYGSTELGVDTILHPPDQLRKPGSCGRPAPGVEVALFDEQGREVTEAMVPGELYVRSRVIFDTYYKAADKYDEDRRGEWHTVGDIAYRDEEGFVYICDRKKDMIISGGMNIYPAEVEAVLEQHPGIFDAAVFGIPSDEWGEAVHAVVVRAPSAADLSAEEVTAYAREHLAGYKIPRSVSFTDEPPRTGSGKLLKRELRAPYWEGHAAQVS
jgi:fatty-acyl-CoA synthase/long-chain acyl-CoA synthetase